jgi:hypothetical protein
VAISLAALEVGFSVVPCCLLQVCDFGLTSPPHVEVDDSLINPLPWRAPEINVAEGQEPGHLQLTPATDMYALGVEMWHTVCVGQQAVCVGEAGRRVGGLEGAGRAGALGLRVVGVHEVGRLHRRLAGRAGAVGLGGRRAGRTMAWGSGRAATLEVLEGGGVQEVGGPGGQGLGQAWP